MGIIKCRAVARFSGEEKWNAKQFIPLRGAPWEFVPGRNDQRIFVAIDGSGNGVLAREDEEEDQEQQGQDDEEGTMVQLRGGAGNFYVSRKAVERYGPTERCAACANIQRRGIAIGRVGINHNDKCRD